MGKRRLTILQLIAHTLAMVPLGVLVVAVVRNDIGPDPAQFVVRELGFWGIVLLWSCLAMTPLRIVTGHPYWIALRRALGLWSFSYITLHLAAFIMLWCGLDFSIVQEELTKRPYIFVGLAAWALMLPLAATSTRRARQFLGKRWNQLHRLVYGTAILALIHLAWVAKLDYSKSIIFSIVLIFLFFIRFRARQRKPASIECASSG